MKKNILFLIAITIVSKLFGFARDITLSYFYGASRITDAYLISITIPSVIFAFPYTYSLFLIITLSNFYELIKFDTFASVLPIILIFIIISFEVFFLYRIFDFNQKYISQIKQLSRSKTDLEVNYYKVYNNNYRLKEKIASSKNQISQKDIDKLQSKQNELQKQFEKETNNVKRIITEIQSSRG